MSFERAFTFVPKYETVEMLRSGDLMKHFITQFSVDSKLELDREISDENTVFFASENKQLMFRVGEKHFEIDYDHCDLGLMFKLVYELDKSGGKRSYYARSTWLRGSKDVELAVKILCGEKLSRTL